MRRLTLFAAAFLVAAGAFWVVMITDPPVTEAAQPTAFSPADLPLPGGLPMSEAPDAS